MTVCSAIYDAGLQGFYERKATARLRAAPSVATNFAAILKSYPTIRSRRMA